jgi:Tfp pilus assembly protein PilF
MNRPAQLWENATGQQRMSAIVLLIVATAIIPYINALSNGFAFDDTFIIQTNARVHNLSAWRDIWLTPYWPSLGRELGLYRPLTIFLFGVQWAVGNGARWVFHLTNVLLHATASVLVFFLLLRLGATRIPAMLGAILFAVHPVHTEAVSNMVGQAEITATCLVLTACVIYARRPDGAYVSWSRRIAISLLYAVALLAKESAVVLPGLLVLIDCIQRRIQLDRRGAVAYLSTVASQILLLISVLLVYLTIRYFALDGTLVGVDAGPAFPYLKEHHVLNAFRAFPEYLRLLFFPADLTVDYVPATVFAVESFTLMSVVGLTILLGLTALMLGAPWVPLVAAGPAWFLISISPVSNIFFPIGVLIAERTLYLPSVAVSIVVAFVATHLATTATPRVLRNSAIAFACAMIAMAARTWVRNPDWKNSNAVQIAVYRDHPESYHAQWARGLVAWDNGLLDEADKWFQLTCRTYCRDSGMLSTYAAFLMAVGEDDRALPLVKTSNQMHRFMPNSTALLGFLFLTTHQPDSALAVIARAEQMRLPHAMTMPMRAYVYQSQGHLAQAAAAWRIVSRSANNGGGLAYGYLARTLAYDGRDAEAHDAIRRGIDVAQDSSFKAILASTDAAITAHCYRREDAPQNGDLYGPPNRPACDPLGSWFDRATNLQGATFSQYAIPKRLITAKRARTKLPNSLPVDSLR